MFVGEQLPREQEGRKERKFCLQALAGASMESIFTKMIGALAKSIGKKELVISIEEEEEGSSSREHFESVSAPSSQG